jgi:hypothetical protein
MEAPIDVDGNKRLGTGFPAMLEDVTQTAYKWWNELIGPGEGDERRGSLFSLGEQDEEIELSVAVLVRQRHLLC